MEERTYQKLIIISFITAVVGGIVLGFYFKYR